MVGKKSKIIILTAPVGGGHVAAAQAVAQSLDRLGQDNIEVQVVDVFTDPQLKLLLPLDKITVPAYSNSVRYLSAYPYKLFYEFADTMPEVVSRFFNTILRDKGAAWLRKVQPDLIVTTFPIIGYCATRLLDEKRYRRVPVISLITDAGDVHRLWLMAQEDAILVSTPETIDYATKAGVPRERLHYLGFPVDRRFSNLPDKATARAHLGLEDRPTVLISGGGLGMNNKLLELARRLSSQPTGGQLLFIGGRNSRLVHGLRQLNFKDPVRIFGFVDNMPELMAAADLIVGKAGWLSLYEAMIARRPTIIIDIVPGQEEPNARFIVDHGVGQVIKEPAAAAEAVADFLAHPKKLAAFQSAFERLDLDPDAGDKIAKFIVGKLHG